MLVELVADNLSISDTFSDNWFDSEDFVIRRQSKTRDPVSDYGKNDSSDDYNVIQNLGWNTCVKTDFYTRTFTRNQGVKQIPLDSTNVSEAVELFFGEKTFLKYSVKVIHILSKPTKV